MITVKDALISGLLLVLTGGLTAAPRFIPPDETRPLLRRDLLPLDSSDMKDLADHLAVIADGPVLPFPADLQRRARTLTLCLRISPAHPEGRNILAALRDEKNRTAPSQEKLEHAKNALISSAQWLIKRPASGEGHLLGQLLLDVLHPGDPDHPLMVTRLAGKQEERWAGVIAELADFENKPAPIPVIATIPETTEPQAPEPKADPYKIKALLTKTPIFSVPQKDSKVAIPVLADLSLIITPRPEAASPFTWKPAAKAPRLSLANRIRQALKATGNPLPNGFAQHISSDRHSYHHSNGSNLAAPIAMMLDSALSGRPLRRNTILLAGLQPDGSLTKPTRSWELLLALNEFPAPANSRLIVSPGLEEEMTALLVMEEASFFTKYEVISAPDLKTARKLFFKDGKPSEDLAAAITGYQEVRKKAFESNSLPTFLSLTSVEQRLVRARSHSASHLSAAMLATQAVRRPADLSRVMLARELHRRLAPLSRVKYQPNVTTLRSIRENYKKTRATLDPLERRLHLREKELFQEALDVIKELNSFGRESETPIQQRNAFLLFKNKLTAFREKLLKISGDAPEK